MAEQQLERKIGLRDATLILIGYVVGASIFILPGQLAGSVGPAVTLSFLLASVTAVFICLVAAQIGAAFPTSGASYIAVSKLLSPYWGFVLVWCYIVASILGIALVAYGFADYLSFFIDDVNRFWVAILLVIALSLLNLTGVRTLVIWQSTMVVLFLVALIVFAIFGVIEIDYSLLHPFFPKGTSPIIAAAVPAAFSFAGFLVIVDIGEEIKSPAKTIPKAIAISFLTVLIIYVSVSLALVGNIHWQEVSGSASPVSDVAKLLFPPWLANGISLAALLAAITSINGIILTASRELLAMSRKGILPSVLSKISPKTQEPYWAVITVSVLSICCILGGASITKYALIAVISIMIIQLLIGIAAFRLPKKLPQIYQESKFKIPSPLLMSFSIGAIIVSIGFLTIGAIDNYKLTLGILFALAISSNYYYFRTSNKIHNSDENL